MKLKHFGTDGIRGIVGRDIDAYYVFDVANAVVDGLELDESNGEGQPKKVVVGWDTRASCDFIVEVIAGVLASRGIDVIKVGIVPTTAVSFITTRLRANLGIVVTASHNNATYNGIKFFNSNGSKLSDIYVKKIDSLIGKKRNKEYIVDRVGRIISDDEAIKKWQKFLIKQFTDLKGWASGKRLAIDCAYGSGAECARVVLSTLGFEIVGFNTDYNGLNINDGCGATKPSWLTNKMKEKQQSFVAGFAFDGDADRCVVFDERGDTVHGDVLMYILTKRLKNKGELKGNKIASTIMFNLGVE